MMKNESGRSMVEMLGVLAIIGVLSIGGIAGYTMAMNRFRANDIVDAASKVIVVAQTRTGTALTANLTDVGLDGTTVGGCVTEMVATATAGTDGGTIVFTGKCTDGVEKAIKSIAGANPKVGNYTVTLGTTTP